MDKQKLVVVLLIVAILFSVVSTVVSLSVMNFKPVMSQPKVVYSGVPSDGYPMGGIVINVRPQPQSEVAQ